jgi:hypothetical protein
MISKLKAEIASDEAPCAGPAFSFRSDISDFGFELRNHPISRFLCGNKYMNAVLA